ncbi:cell envelope integrity protein CreD [Roseateles saccharophilus]|uniref:Inner membrane protein n=1 Tax=Roseateles saccharophilus TaxID=304 RepID=A0A4V2VR61_ROSSA|nr:cell envelope integrity protein CreD [Roseateles saccharophilus]MDG0831984.1 cell envelope integrity protein CreD [Roseateles saccharophilus]TCU97349.1 inner membrane protein [Roseateles saccharophilus]
MKLNPTFSKLAILAVVTLLLCIVLAEIGGLVRERQQRQNEAAQSVVQSLADAQTLLGPVLTRNCTETWTEFDAKKKPVQESRNIPMALTPSTLELGGRLDPELHYRGLFKVNAYAARLKIDAQWETLAPLEAHAEHAGGRLNCEPVNVFFAASDNRGLRSAVIQAGDDTLLVQPGTLQGSYRAGLHATLPDHALKDGLRLSLALDVVGTQSLSIVPTAGKTHVALTSSWPHPSFGGRFLPIQREVMGSGFTAQWQVSALQTSAAADAQDGKPLPNLDSFGVELIDPVNPYVMSDRAIKYGLMFIALTFVTVGLTELLSGRRVHPVQYLLVGLAISLFFLLLLSLSEHMSFLNAYLIAAAAAAAVLTQYAAAMLGGWLRGLAFGAGIALLYTALYVLLSQEQAALAIGAVLLFAVLAAVMMLTRKLDWYRLASAGAGAE